MAGTASEIGYNKILSNCEQAVVRVRKITIPAIIIPKGFILRTGDSLLLRLTGFGKLSI
jgi:hypothetical protein